MERLDRAHWKQLQSLMQDSVKFVELLHTIEWEEGLPNEINQSMILIWPLSTSNSLINKWNV